MPQLVLLTAIIVSFGRVIGSTTRNPFISPEFGFITCFLPSAIAAMSYVDKWDLSFSANTIWVFIVGFSVFFIVSFVVANALRLPRARQISDDGLRPRASARNDSIVHRVQTWKLIVVILLEVISLLLTFHFILSNYGSDLSIALGNYRRATTSGGDDLTMSLPLAVKIFRRIALAAGFICSYLLCVSLIFNEKKNRGLYYCAVALSFINGLALGGRGESLLLAAAFVIQYSVVRRSRFGDKVFSAKATSGILAAAVAGLLVFLQLSELLGRNMSFLSAQDYLAVYLAAPLKNLDIFASTGHFGTSLDNSQTLANISPFLAWVADDPRLAHSFDNPFNFINGHPLGNVSTVFYAFLYDGGFVTTVIMTAIMAIVSQIAFHRALEADAPTEIQLAIVFYSYLWSCLVFSFFSDKFFENMLSTSFLWLIVSWVVLKAFLTTRSGALLPKRQPVKTLRYGTVGLSTRGTEGYKRD